MPKNRRPSLVLPAACVIGALAIAIWRLADPPVEVPGEPAEKALSHAAKPAPDTAYRPAPSPADERPDQTLRPALAQMLSDGTPPARRIEILDGMEPGLIEAEARALIHELSIIPAAEQGSAWHSTYIHELCNLLQDVGATHDDFASALATVSANRDLPIVYRDYAFQHLRILWRSSRDASTQAGRTRMEAIENTFLDLLTRRPETAAQSLLGLHEIRESAGTPVVPDGEIARLAHGILDSPPAAESIPVRMTAVRVLAERRIPENSGRLRAIAASDAEHGLVRASAVAALGFIGDPADLEFLKSLPSDDPLVAGALRHAFNRQ